MLNEERVVLRETRVDSVAGVVLALLSSVVCMGKTSDTPSPVKSEAATKMGGERNGQETDE